MLLLPPLQMEMYADQAEIDENGVDAAGTLAARSQALARGEGPKSNPRLNAMGEGLAEMA